MTLVGNREIQRVLTRRRAGVGQERASRWQAGGGWRPIPGARQPRTAQAYTTPACFPRDHAQLGYNSTLSRHYFVTVNFFHNYSPQPATATTGT